MKNCLLSLLVVALALSALTLSVWTFRQIFHGAPSQNVRSVILSVPPPADSGTRSDTSRIWHNGDKFTKSNCPQCNPSLEPFKPSGK